MEFLDWTDFKPDGFTVYPINKYLNPDADYTTECDDIFTFDIECTGAWLDDNGQLIEYKKGMSDDYWNSLVPVSVCYKWQFSFNDKVYHGRDLKDFVALLEKIPSTMHIIIYVHNLAYEFQFLNNYLKPWDRVFARTAHKPMSAVSSMFPNIEFKCSYILTRLSLESWGDSLGLPKLHTLQYEKLRTPLTKLTEDEMKYCERDCEVVYLGIKNMLKTYKHIKDIPLTQTGCVRREIKNRVIRDKTTANLMRKLVPADVNIYRKLKRVFQGGYTHANYILSGWNVGAGNQYDFASSYPYVMCSERFPMTPFVKAPYDKNKTDEYAFLVYLRLESVEAKTYNHYISFSKTDVIENEVLDNGRVMSADVIEMWATEQDIDIIKKTYNIKKSKVIECYRSKKEYLPKVFVDYILELYGNKTSFKDVAGKEDIYTQSKQFINSVFGMSVTDILQDDIVFTGNDWYTEFKSVEDVENKLKEMRDNPKEHPFIAYQWGPWITAYARHNLWECLIPNDENVIYCDTDSIKMVGDADFTWYNNKVDEKLLKMCEILDIDFSRTRPKTPKGKEKPLGYFAKEEPFTEFKTLGAKRYIYRDAESGKLKLTISGINKAAVACLDDNIDNFKDDFVFDKDHETVSKKYLVYTDKQPDIIWNKGQYDEYKSDARYGIVMRPMGYKLGVSPEYATLIGLIDALVENSDLNRNYLKCI